jgi:hypothetical protein
MDCFAAGTVRWPNVRKWQMEDAERELSARIVEFGTKVRQNRSALVLILANLVPLGGVVFAHWSAFYLVWLFWFENVIIGGFNVLKMLTVGLFGNPIPEAAKTALAEAARRARGDWGPAPRPGRGETPLCGTTGRVAGLGGMAFMAAFFTVHYGGFSFVHGVFVVALLGKGSAMREGMSPAGFSLWDIYVHNPLVAISEGLGLAMLVLVFSHAFSFVANFLVKREYARTGVDRLMGGPYARVVILHVAIILGAFFALALGSPVVLLVLLVLLKIGLDLVLHLKERQHAGAIPILLLKRKTTKST